MSAVSATARVISPPTAVKGMVYALLAVTLWGAQDAMTKFLVSAYPISQFLLVRFAVFAAFAIVYAAMRGGLAQAVASRRPVLQLTRAALLIVDILLFCLALRYMGLADLHAIYATTPLMVTVLAGLLLGEVIGWRRRTALLVGFLGAMIIIRPGLGVFNPAAFLVLGAGLCFALYSIATRKVSGLDSVETSTLYTAAAGTLMLLPFGIAQWQPVDWNGALLMGGISVTGLLGHLLYIRALSHAPAVAIQPLTYLLLVWAVFYSFVLFNNLPDFWTVAGAIVVVVSGLYVTWREWVRGREAELLKLPGVL